MDAMSGRKQPSGYLQDVPPLSDELLRQLGNRRGPTPDAMREADRVLNRLRQLIRQARERHERETGKPIIPERPVAE